MIKLGTTTDLKTLERQLPIEVYNLCFDTLETLEECYGKDRNIYTDLGGFLVVIEDCAQFLELKEYNLDIFTEVAEFVDVIGTDECTYVSALFLLSSDFAIKVVTKKEIVPINILKMWGCL